MGLFSLMELCGEQLCPCSPMLMKAFVLWELNLVIFLGFVRPECSRFDDKTP